MPGERQSGPETPWILLHHSDPYCFYYTRFNDQITGFGICGESTPSKLGARKPQHFVTSTPSPPSKMVFSGLFLSVASLSKLERVDVCRRGCRCTGILIHYISGKCVALGQWHTDNASSSRILDSRWPGRSKICFTMSKSGRASQRPYIKDVCFLAESPDEVSDQERVFGLEQVMLSKGQMKL